MQTNVLEYLENIVDKVPDKVAYANEKDELTFCQVYDRSRGIGSFLLRQGFSREPVEMALFNKAANDLKRAGAEVIILGCTELSTIKQTHGIGGEFIDALEVMARRCVLSCGAPSNPNTKT